MGKCVSRRAHASRTRHRPCAHFSSASRVRFRRLFFLLYPARLRLDVPESARIRHQQHTSAAPKTCHVAAGSGPSPPSFTAGYGGHQDIHKNPLPSGLARDHIMELPLPPHGLVVVLSVHAATIKWSGELANCWFTQLAKLVTGTLQDAMPLQAAGARISRSCWKASEAPHGPQHLRCSCAPGLLAAIVPLFHTVTFVFYCRTSIARRVAIQDTAMAHLPGGSAVWITRLSCSLKKKPRLRICPRHPRMPACLPWVV